MPQSLKDIIDHAEDLARRFENADPDDGIEITVEEFRLQRAVVTRARSEQKLADAVAGARAAGVTWQRIGAMLGVSAQAAQQRYAHAG